jgi:ParB/RepB/Spo0J family partition protein
MCPSEYAPPASKRLSAASATKRSTEQNAESIRQHGLIPPITVRPNSEGFEIVAGARRFRAAQLVSFTLTAVWI